MKTAVIILNWNGEKILPEFLPSVLAHTPEARIVVADNGSTDRSLEMLGRDFPQVETVALGENFGFAEGYNRAVSRTEGCEYVLLLNSDVEVTENWLEDLEAVLDRDRSVAVVAPKLLGYERRDEFEYAGACGGYIDYLGYPFCRGRVLDRMEKDDGQYDRRTDVFWTSGAAMLVRREVFLKLGGFASEFFAHMEEIDFCWRVQLSGYRVVVEPSSTVYHLGGATLRTGSARKIFCNHRNNLAMLFRCAPPFQRLTAAVLRPLLDVLASFTYLVQGKTDAFIAVYGAYYDFFRWHSRLRKERREIRKDRVRESCHVYKGFLLLDYLFGKRKFSDIAKKKRFV